ncbi:MAG: hypothetical protein IJD28_02235 [Deferribacterales bacterium]|nr:hypothetical protein [Deferribacterales bacterium]
MSKLEIQINLSVDKSGGEEKLPVVIEKIKEAVTSKYPQADIVVRKGYFKTIDGIWSSDSTIENDIKNIIADVRKQVL